MGSETGGNCLELVVVVVGNMAYPLVVNKMTNKRDFKEKFGDLRLH